MDPDELAKIAGYPDVKTQKIGDRLGRGVAPKSRVTWRFPMFADDLWAVSIRALVDKLGGSEALRLLIDTVRPGTAWVRLNVPSVGSPWQESNGLDNATLRLLADLGLDFDVAVFQYDESRPTHGQKPGA